MNKIPEKITHTLNLPDKGVSEASGALSKLFRKITDDIKLNPNQWGVLMVRYLNDPRNDVKKDVKDKSSARGNLNKELMRTSMTWKVFRKGLRFLGPTWIRFEVHMGWPDRPPTVTSLDIKSGPVEEPDEADENLPTVEEDLTNPDTPNWVNYLHRSENQ